MKKSGLVLMLSAVAICDAAAGETIQRNQRFAQMDQPARANSSGGSCMPIGLTARGELVFPWECRAIIERERGPVSSDIFAPSQDPAKYPAPIEPIAREPAPKAAVANDAASKDQPAPQSMQAEPGHVGTIPDAISLPPQAAVTVGPSDRRSQRKRLAVRGATDSKGPPHNPAPPTTVHPIRASRIPPPG